MWGWMQASAPKRADLLVPEAPWCGLQTLLSRPFSRSPLRSRSLACFERDGTEGVVKPSRLTLQLRRKDGARARPWSPACQLLTLPCSHAQCLEPTAMRTLSRDGPQLWLAGPGPKHSNAFAGRWAALSIQLAMAHVRRAAMQYTGQSSPQPHLTSPRPCIVAGAAFDTAFVV